MEDSYQDPKPGKTYVSPSLKAFGNSNRRVRIATKALEQPETYAFAQIKGELVLRHHEDAKTCITAKFFEDDRGIFVLTFQGYTVATEKPHNASFSFVGDEIGQLVEFLNHIQAMPLSSGAPLKITDEALRRVVLSNAQAQAMVQDNQALFAEIVRSAVTKEDLIAVGYRKRELDRFRRLLEEPDCFDQVKAKYELTDEAVWQRFFEKNPWIFGYGLTYLPLSGLDDKKLEQVVHGHSVAGPGKRADALLKTRGVISSLCFVEIKTHRTALLGARPYRPGCWAPSVELAGGVAQVQTSVALAADTIRTKLVGKNPLGEPTGEKAFNYAPTSFLVIGRLDEFVGEHGVNEEKFRAFELFRRHTHHPDVLTFDELYARAKFIVDQYA
ncbi:Shedu immune nuclease family protein [Metallibacterium scheffleri]|uniref:Shedu protein SduA C-terminal domain-containing protein n=1 Tax=Metallibacterium scheffleri TaxID=993689 RepID=A0A4S3KML5_9GAMM|nr:Shedu immune nuclease family protein [Metallibacterium scheffleri]THD10153.1 hypothetical protein B1806_09785 [Metallibacterium scheffleri]